MKKSYQTFVRIVSAHILLMCVTTGVVFSQINQEIYFKYCVATPDTACFTPAAGTIDTVGRDVDALGGGYRFCLPVEMIGGGTGPIQVVIAIDKSGSMVENDADDMRTEAAHYFVDSLRVKAPDSYVGSAVFSNGFTSRLSLPPVKISDSTAYDTLWNSLENGANTPQLRKTLATTQGAAITAALDMLLALGKTVPGMKQHIIMITDDGWYVDSDIKPEGILEKYRPLFPAGSFPQIHTVVLTGDGNPATSGVLGLANIQMIADSTAGLYIEDATPPTIVAKLSEILESISVTVLNSLESMTVTNLNNGETRNHTSIKVVQGADQTISQFQATIDNLPLAFGLNRIVVTRVEKKSGTDQLVTRTDTTSIYRTSAWTSTVNPDEYSIYCTDDSTSLSITASPDYQLINVPFDVTARITLKNKFLLDTVQLRIFSQNSDVDDNNTVALFHLDNKDLKSSIGKIEATGTAVEISKDPLFGEQSLKSGSFKFTIGRLAGDFAFEAWVKPTTASTAQEIFSTSNLALAITADRYLTLTSNGKVLSTSAVAVDAGVWSHVAVSRYMGKLYIFINGMVFSDAVAFDADVSGALTVKGSGQLDEVRISSVHRLVVAADGSLRFGIASLQNPAWTLAGAPSAQPLLLASPDKWTSGTLKLTFASPVPGRFIVNMVSRGTTIETQWSKNSNPVYVGADQQGPYITKSIFTRGDLQAEYDTLDIFFSEPVLCDSLKKNLAVSVSFEVYDSNRVIKSSVFDGAQFIDNSCAASKLITEVRVKVKPGMKGIIPLKDSILLVGITVDTAGNYPDAAHRGPIAYGPGSGIRISLMMNDPTKPPMTIYEPTAIRLGIPQGERSGRLIVLTTREALAIPPGGSANNYAEKSCIYDAVGNLIASDVPLKQSPVDQRLYYLVWNGLNRNNRRVANGAYLYRATVRYSTDAAMNIDRKIQQQVKLSIDWGRK